MGARLIWKRLEESGFLKRKGDYWCPTEKAKKLALFKVVDDEYFRDEVRNIYDRVLVTRKGQKFFIDYFCKEGQITMEEYFGEAIEESNDDAEDKETPEDPPDKIPEHYIQIQKDFEKWDGQDDGYNFDERDEKTGLILNFPGRELTT